MLSKHDYIPSSFEGGLDATIAASNDHVVEPAPAVASPSDPDFRLLASFPKLGHTPRREVIAVAPTAAQNLGNRGEFLWFSFRWFLLIANAGLISGEQRGRGERAG